MGRAQRSHGSPWVKWTWPTRHRKRWGEGEEVDKEAVGEGAGREQGSQVGHPHMAKAKKTRKVVHYYVLYIFG